MSILDLDLACNPQCWREGKQDREQPEPSFAGKKIADGIAWGGVRCRHLEGQEEGSYNRLGEGK